MQWCLLAAWSWLTQDPGAAHSKCIPHHGHETLSSPLLLAMEEMPKVQVTLEIFGDLFAQVSSWTISEVFPFPPILGEKISQGFSLTLKEWGDVPPRVMGGGKPSSRGTWWCRSHSGSPSNQRLLGNSRAKSIWILRAMEDVSYDGIFLSLADCFALLPSAICHV